MLRHPLLALVAILASCASVDRPECCAHQARTERPDKLQGRTDPESDPEWVIFCDARLVDFEKIPHKPAVGIHPQIDATEVPLDRLEAIAKQLRGTWMVREAPDSDAAFRIYEGEVKTGSVWNYKGAGTKPVMMTFVGNSRPFNGYWKIGGRRMYFHAVANNAASTPDTHSIIYSEVVVGGVTRYAQLMAPLHAVKIP